VGYSCALPFAIFLLVFAAIHAIIAKSVLISTLGARFRWLNIVAMDGKRVPFAPTIAASLIGTFMLGCLDARPVHYIPNNIPLGTQRVNTIAPPQSQ